MKNILSNLGYISRPALIGTVLGVATVAVGIGIVTNFSGGAPKAPKGLSSAALEQSVGDLSSQAQSASAGYSKEALEAGMAAAEMQRNNPSVYNLKEAAGTEQFAYSKSGVNGVDQMQAAEGGSVEGISGAGQSAIEAGAVAQPDAAAADQRAAKVDAGIAGAEAAKAQLSTSKTMSGNFTRGGSASGSGSGSSASSYNLPKTADNKAGSAQIPQGAASALAKGPKADAFKSGRAGELGGYNVKAQGDKAGGNGQAFFSTTVGELSNAARYSQAGKKTVYGDSSKGTALAQAAFDGSETAAEGVKISGTNVQQGAAQALEQSANSMDMRPKNKPSNLDNIDADVQTYKDVRSELWSKIIQAAIITIGAIFAITAGIKAGGFWGWLAAGAAAAVALLAIWATGVPKLLSQLHGLKYTGGMNATWTSILAYSVLGILTAAVGLAFVIGLKAKAAAKAAADKLAAGGTKEAAAAAAKEKGGRWVSNKAAGKMAEKAAASTAANAAESAGGNVIKDTLINQATNSASNVVNNVGSGSGSSSSGSTASAGENPYPKGSQEWSEWNAEH